MSIVKKLTVTILDPETTISPLGVLSVTKGAENNLVLDCLTAGRSVVNRDDLIQAVAEIDLFYKKVESSELTKEERAALDHMSDEAMVMQFGQDALDET